MVYDESYVKDLEETISKFLKPIKDIPFNIVIKSLSGYSVIPFDKNNSKDIGLLQNLTKAVELATKTANNNGIYTNRINEVGNAIEPFVRNALNTVGLEATIPLSKDGKANPQGYPDIKIKEKDGRTTYLECKTYNIKSIDSSYRTFYLSPSEGFKVTTDARHLLVSFEIMIDRRNDKMAFVPINWQIYTLDKLKVNIKNEFNASNKTLYLQDALLAQGKI